MRRGKGSSRLLFLTMRAFIRKCARSNRFVRAHMKMRAPATRYARSEKIKRVQQIYSIKKAIYKLQMTFSTRLSRRFSSLIRKAPLFFLPLSEEIDNEYKIGRAHV